MKLNKDTNIVIVGLGLMGGSYAAALAKKGYKVYGIADNQKAIDYAIQNKMICGGSDHPDESILKNADIVIFCLYPAIFIEWIKKYHSILKKGAIITDVTGIKSGVVYEVQKILGDDNEYISAHPMAGKESSGIENSDPSKFTDANYIVVPTDKNTPEAIELCKFLGEELGFSKISILSPESHDDMIAFLSQLTHIIAVVLMTCNDNTHLAPYSGDSFRDLTRIAKINGKMWAELFDLNKEKLLKHMESFSESFEQFKKMLEAGDREGMKNIMDKSFENRMKFEAPERK